MDLVEIIEYEDKYLSDIRDLLVELEEYIVSIDLDNLDCVHEEYYEKMALVDLDNIKKNHGKCYLAILNKEVIGLIMGIIIKYDKYDYLDYKCPKEGEIIELIVSSKFRKNNVGSLLMDKIEQYFKDNNCDYILLDVFAYNESAINFYKKRGYHSRMYRNIKKINKNNNN